jgi:hypothetical protein
MSINQIDSTGIQTKALNDIISSLQDSWKAIFGSDVNLDTNSPDGQLIYNIALIIMDSVNLLVEDYDSKDPDQAVGVALDGVSQLCGITRKGGTYTQVNISVVTTQALNLVGQDGTNPFTITDGQNQFQLVASTSLISGTNTLLFRSVNIGDVQIALNTLTTVLTPVLGVASVNNPTVPTQQGTDQETDGAYRLRRQASVALPAQNAMDGLRGALLQLNDVVDALVLENTGSGTNGDGIPGHGIWVIVEGGTGAEVSQLIYLYRPAGIPMAGAISVNVSQEDGSTFVVNYDNAVSQNLYVNLTVTSKSGGSIDSTAIQNGLAAAMNYKINNTADVSSIIAALFTINPDAVVHTATVNIYGGSPAAQVAPTLKKNYFSLSASNITVTVV